MPIDIEDPAQLLAYLDSRGHVRTGGPPSISVLEGGVSAKTVLVAHPDGEGWVLKQALPELRVADRWVSDPTRIRREADGMRILNELLEPGRVPRLVFEDRDEHIVAMEQVPPPFENWKTMLLEGDLRFEQVADFASLLARIHVASAKRAADIEPIFRDDTNFHELRLDAYYDFTGRRHAKLGSFFDDLIGDTLEHRFALVHGDYSPKNILMRPTGCVLVDHEVAHWGDAGFDVGFSTTHFLSKANHLMHMRREFADAALHHWATYRSRVRTEPWFDGFEERSVRHTLGCLLARIDGKSPLEYLDESERERQRSAVVATILDHPTTFAEMVPRYVRGLNVDA